MKKHEVREITAVKLIEWITGEPLIVHPSVSHPKKESKELDALPDNFCNHQTLTEGELIQIKNSLRYAIENNQIDTNLARSIYKKLQTFKQGETK